MNNIYHSWDSDNYSLIQRCNVCGCNRVKTPHPLLYVYYYDCILIPITEMPKCILSINNQKSNLNKLT